MTAGALVTPTATLVTAAAPDTPEWAAARRAGITGSDVAAILGMDPYQSPYGVWLDKTGQLPDLPRSAELAEAAEWGHELEDHVARRFAARTGHDVIPGPGTLARVDATWMRANVDRLVIEAESDGDVAVAVYGEDDEPPYADVTAVLECKTRSAFQLADWTDGVPDRTAVQTHWYLAVTGYPRGYVAALVGGNRMVVHRLEADDELLAELVDAAGRFRVDHVEAGVPPPVDGSEVTEEILAHLYEASPGATVALDPAEVEPLLAARAAADADLAAAETRKRAAENALKALIGEHEIAVAAGATRFTWKRNGPFASKRFRDDHPELAGEYATTAPALDTDRLAAERPEVYAAYRSRRLHVPKGAR